MLPSCFAFYARREQVKDSPNDDEATEDLGDRCKKLGSDQPKHDMDLHLDQVRQMMTMINSEQCITYSIKDGSSLHQSDL